jgi:hypothetical protein
MKLAHIHIAFTDLPAAVAWFKTVMALEPSEEGPGLCVFQWQDVELVLNADWGDGDTSCTLAAHSDDCNADYALFVSRGARERSAPRDKGSTRNADVFGPGRLVVELEQKL